MKKVVFYARVSTEEEKQMDALSKQTDELTNFIINHDDWNLVDKYIDEGKSGTTTHGRYQYNRLFDDLSTNKFDILVIKDQSRLMRNVLDWYLFIDKLNKNKKQLYLYLDNKFYVPDDAFLTGIKAMMAEEYSRDLSKKIKSAAKRSQLNGTVYGNNSIVGYKQNKGKLIIDGYEAEIVKRVFDLYISGKGFRTIKNIFDEEGVVKSDGKPISSISSFKRMIRNEKYKGVLVCGKQEYNFETKKYESKPQSEWIYIPNGVPAIVSEEVWEKANAILEQRREQFSYNDDQKNKEIYQSFLGAYPLSKKIKCGKCGATYWYDSRQAKSRKTHCYPVWICGTYKSYGKKSKLGCDNRIIRDDEIMSVCRKTLFDYFKENNNNQKLIDETMKILKKTIHQNNNNQEQEQKKFVSEKSKIENKKSKLLDALLDDTIGKEDYKIRNEEFDIKLAELNDKLNSFKNDEASLISEEERLSKIKKYLETKFASENEITDEVIKNMITKIVVNEDSIEIYIGDDTSNIKYHFVPDSVQYRLQTDTFQIGRTDSTINLYVSI